MLPQARVFAPNLDPSYNRTELIGYETAAIFHHYPNAERRKVSPETAAVFVRAVTQEF